MILELTNNIGDATRTIYEEDDPDAQPLAIYGDLDYELWSICQHIVTI